MMALQTCFEEEEPIMALQTSSDEEEVMMGFQACFTTKKKL